MHFKASGIPAHAYERHVQAFQMPVKAIIIGNGPPGYLFRSLERLFRPLGGMFRPLQKLRPLICMLT